MCCYIYGVVLCCRLHFDNFYDFSDYVLPLFELQPLPWGTESSEQSKALTSSRIVPPCWQPAHFDTFTLFYGTCMDHIFLTMHDYNTHNAWGLLLPSGIWVVRLIQEHLWRNRSECYCTITQILFLCGNSGIQWEIILSLFSLRHFSVFPLILSSPYFPSSSLFPLCASLSSVFQSLLHASCPSLSLSCSATNCDGSDTV